MPTEEGWTHYRALYSIGKAPVNSFCFPAKRMDRGSLTHQLRKLNEEEAWFDTYLFKTKPPENEALKKDRRSTWRCSAATVQKVGAFVRRDVSSAC